MNVIDYFQSILKYHHQKWGAVLDHFKNYVGGDCTFDELTIDFCNGFRKHLSSTKRIHSEKHALSQNSAAGYWSTFRAFLALAYNERIPQGKHKGPPRKNRHRRTPREYLTMQKLKTLYDTPCRFPVLKAASIFSCLTRLRLSNILRLKWDIIQEYPDGGKCVRIRIEKTETEATLPISEHAFELCGEPGTGIVFKRLTRGIINTHLKDRIKSSGINKHITFHTARHSYLSFSLKTNDLQNLNLRRITI